MFVRVAFSKGSLCIILYWWRWWWWCGFEREVELRPSFPLTMTVCWLHFSKQPSINANTTNWVLEFCRIEQSNAKRLQQPSNRGSRQNISRSINFWWKYFVSQLQTSNFQLSTLISKQPVIPQYPPCNNSPSITHVLYGNAAGLLDGWLVGWLTDWLTFWLRNPECEVLMCWTVLYQYFVFRLAAIWTRGYIFPVPVVVVVVVLFDINAFLKALNVSCCRYYCRVGSCPVFLPSKKREDRIVLPEGGGIGNAKWLWWWV